MKRTCCHLLHMLLFYTLVGAVLLLLANASSTSTSDAHDFYALLGVAKTATTQEIKQAYRRKARDTHPDKNKNVAPEEAAQAFHKVVHAFEILSDASSRRRYDTSGGKWRGDPNSTGSSGGQRQGGGGGSYSNFHWQWGRRPVRLKDKFEAQQAQSRILHVVSLEQLRTIMLDDDDLLERNVLLCFVTPGNVETIANDEIVFPYPFAGMSEQGIWWEDLLQTVMVRFHRGNDLTKLFDIPSGDEVMKSGKPIFVFAKKGTPLSSTVTYERVQTDERHEFEKFAWKMIEVRVLFHNLHTHPVEVYWVHGNRAHTKGTIQPNAILDQTSMLTHEFYVRDERIDAFPTSPGQYRMTNQSGLGSWKIGIEGMPPIREDGTILIEIRSRDCMDWSGHCPFWKDRGECLTNPAFMNEKCPLTCKVCSEQKEDSQQDDDEL